MSKSGLWPSALVLFLGDIEFTLVHIADPGINARYARVSYVDQGEFDVSEEQYRAEGHKPDFDNLLSREKYDTANRPGARDRPERGG